jgi:hypothetical protein
MPFVWSHKFKNINALQSVVTAEVVSEVTIPEVVSEPVVQVTVPQVVSIPVVEVIIPQVVPPAVAATILLASQPK